MSDSRPPTPESLEVKRRGRHRLIGAITLAVLAVVAIPMMLDSEPRKVSKDLALNIPAKDNLPALAPPDEKAAAAAAATAAAAVASAAPPATATAPAEKAAVSEKSAEKAQDKAPEKVADKALAKVEAGKSPEGSRPDKILAKSADKPASKAPDKAAQKVPDKAADKAAEKTAEKTAEKAAAKPADKPADRTPAAGEGYVIQLGAFSDADKLAALKAKMKAAKVTVFTEEVQTSTGKLTRLRAGPYKTREQADKALATIKKAGGEGKVVPLS